MFSRTCEYAMRAVLYVAAQSDADSQDKIGIKTIAKELEVPAHFLSKILQTLTRHKLLSSIKGPNGGFYLDKRQRKKTLLQVVKIIDGEDVFKKCGLGLKYCSDNQPCPVHFEFVEYRNGIKATISKHTIQEMAERTDESKHFIK